MSIKKIIFNRIFNQRQRNVIWNAVLFSQHTYRRRGQVDNAAVVQQVINEVAYLFKVKRNYSQEEVDAMIQAVTKDFQNYQTEAENKINKAYQKGVSDGVKKALSDVKNQLNEMKTIRVSGIVIKKKDEDDVESDGNGGSMPDNDTDNKDTDKGREIPVEGKKEDEIEK
nr:MAG TPA: Cell cycle protein [Caudoviricetes sp.]